MQSRDTFSRFHVGEFHESHEVGSVLETRQKSRTRERMFSCVFPKKWEMHASAGGASEKIWNV